MTTRGNWMEDRMGRALEERRRKGNLRRLQASASGAVAGPNGDGEGPMDGTIDFSSNDYLGLARDPAQRALVAARLRQHAPGDDDGDAAAAAPLGATGSRLLSGDAPAFHDLEAFLAVAHRRPAALLCNSGYDANLSVVSSLLCDTILYDDDIHNSLHMGLRLWRSRRPAARAAVGFRHNDAADLEARLRRMREDSPSQTGSVVVLIESVYSMDGDIAPIRPILDVCLRHHALLVVDEAHGLGVCGRPRRADALPGTGVVAMAGAEHHPALLCSVHTFGKAAGCHGAVVCGSERLKEYLVNYGYPFIYSTALPPHSLVAIRCAYETMTGPRGDRLRDAVLRTVEFFRGRLEEYLLAHCPSVRLLASTTPIQALLVPGNEECTRFCRILYRLTKRRILLYPIKTPTVPAGQERIRIIIHAHNTVDEVKELVGAIQATLEEMKLSTRPPRQRARL